MATKQSGIPCYDKAAPDEPVFVLRAQDVTSADTVRHWARNALARGAAQEKVDEAFKCATDMETWQQLHLDTVKIPD